MRIRFAIVFLLAGPLLARAEIPARPYPAVVYSFEERTTPQPQRIHVAAIDLSNPLVSVRVSRGGADPDGDGRMQTTLMSPVDIAEREGFDVVINGDFFSARAFKPDVPATVSGPAVSQGKLWGPTTQPRAAFLMNREKRPAIAVVTDPPADAYEVIAGSDVILKDGKIVAPDNPGFPRGPHPRTAVGIAEDGKVLLLVVVDGRQKGKAAGMSLVQLAEVMLKYGAQHAVNLDGGGSTAMAIRDPETRKLQVVNRPSGGTQRPVANVLGVTVTRRAGSTTRPAR